MKREVTEQDFRMPEFRDAKVEDYEFRADGKLVRKDRWEQAVHAIKSIVGPHTREFEIEDVVDRVRELADNESWTNIEIEEGHYVRFTVPENEAAIDMQLADGSILLCGKFDRSNRMWVWNRSNWSDHVVAWRLAKK